MPDITGWPHRAPQPGRSYAPPMPTGALRRIWPTLRTALWILFAIALVGCEALKSARFISHGLAFWLMLAWPGVMLLFGLAEEIFERLRLIDKQKPAKPAIDVNEIPAPPVPPPVADKAPREPEKPAANAPSGGALPARFGGATWGLEGGYVWRPRERDPE